MSLSAQQFEETKSRILLMNPKQLQELSRILSATSPKLEASPRTGTTPGAVLHQHIQQVLATRTRNPIPSLSSLKRLKPRLAERFEAVGKEFHLQLSSMFPKVTLQEFYGIYRYFVQMAVNRVEDLDKVLSPENVMDALIPLHELVDDQLPGYRSAGILQTMVLRKINGGYEKCMATIR
ncbi:MAG: hypothetical protein ABIN58_01860 [candidate division WOR-3 bacterium]